MPVTSVVCDFGAVLAWPPSSSVCERLAGLSGIPREVLLQRYYKERAAYDNDEISPVEYWRSIVRGYPAASDDALLAWLAAEDVDAWSEPNEATVGWLPELHRRGYRLALLSNMPGPFWDVLRDRVDWLGRFDHCLISGKLGLSKPDSRVFALLLDTLDCPASEVVFLDDSPKNVAAAAELGIRAELYNVFHGGLPDIARRNGLPVPRENAPDEARRTDSACSPHRQRE